MATLYEIEAELDAVLAAIEDADGEITPELAAELERLGAAEAKKLEAIVGRYRDRLAFAAAAKAEAKRLSERAATAERGAKRLAEWVGGVMRARGLRRLECPIGGFRWQANGGVLPLEVLVPVDRLPAPFVLVKVEEVPNVAAMREVLEQGDAPDGEERRLLVPNPDDPDGEPITIAVLRPRGESVRAF